MYFHITKHHTCFAVPWFFSFKYYLLTFQDEDLALFPFLSLPTPYTSHPHILPRHVHCFAWFSIQCVPHGDSTRHSEQSHVVKHDYFSFIIQLLSSLALPMALYGVCVLLCVCYYFNFQLYPYLLFTLRIQSV